MVLQDLVSGQPRLVDVGIGEMCLSESSEEVLVTHALGSCIGLALFDRRLRLGGLIHTMLPLSSASSDSYSKAPLMFTDTGVAILLQEMFDLGCRREHIVAKVAGAGSQVDHGGLFRIGERNYAVLRRILWKNDILIAAEDIGGSVARTMALEIATGRTMIRSQGTQVDL